MKRSEVKDFIPLLQAWADGKTIQWSCIGEDRWHEVSADHKESFDTDVYKYRIKPEPREWYEVAFHGEVFHGSPAVPANRYATLEEAQKNTPRIAWGSIIKVREVTE